MSRGQAALRPGRVRYEVAAILFAVTAISYADRATLSIAGSALQHDLGLNSITMGFIFSAFGWSYVAAQIPGGLLLDRFGSRRVYLFSIIFWSLFTLAQATVAGFAAPTAVVVLFALRFLLGLAEAPSFPANARLVAAWFPSPERGTATAVFNSAQYFAVAAFAPFMGWLTHAHGWQSVFLAMGALGFVAAAGFAWRIHPPLRHPRLGEAERRHLQDGGALISLDGAAEDAKATRTVAWGDLRLLTTNRMLLGIYLGQYGITALTYFFATWFPIYLIQERGLSVLQAGFAAIAPALAGWVGGILGGVWSDLLLRRGHSLTVARKLPIVCGLVISLSIMGCIFVHAEWLVVVLMALAFFGKGVAALGWVVIADTAPRTRTGLAGGIFNAIGNTAGIVTPIVIGFIVAATGSFDLALVFVAAHALLAIIAYLVVVGPIIRLGDESTNPPQAEESIA